MNKGELRKLYLLSGLIKAHARRGKSLVIFNVKNNIFQILQKIQNYIVTVKISFVWLHLCNYTFPPILRWNGGFIKLHSYTISNNAEPFNLIQICPLLQVAPVTFCPTLPCGLIYSKKNIVVFEL